MEQFNNGQKVKHPVFGVGIFLKMYKPYGRVADIRLNKEYLGRMYVSVDIQSLTKVK